MLLFLPSAPSAAHDGGRTKHALKKWLVAFFLTAKWAPWTNHLDKYLLRLIC